ncbi:helix-turn-helix transcriptional regulator [Paenibacillus agricola]|uniref:Helix-turn-helix transcriptional regulator n=1 Tax=Paenibacillus agricola TaxID=2716264 RepID=A0ABX0J0H3_9BACL|nr:AraC family transcriptional regulator [Paenibacillus agricola]NHN28960.1 helix-turn-helix transcriptional regulator [Paenibacillus agricola]
MISGASTAVAASRIPAKPSSAQDEDYSLFHASLSESLVLIQLLEERRWDAAEQKLRDLFAQWYAAEDMTGELALEMFYMLCMVYSYAASRQGRQPESVFGNESTKLAMRAAGSSLTELEQWAMGSLNNLRADQDGAFAVAVPHSNDIIQHIQQIVQQNLHEDVSLQLLSDKVNLHPKYVSWLYKNETGEGFNDYVHRLKMERAVHFLRNSRKKVYEIASNLGYQHTSYFIRVFKERFQMTPQQYRDQ